MIKSKDIFRKLKGLHDCLQVFRKASTVIDLFETSKNYAINMCFIIKQMAFKSVSDMQSKYCNDSNYP